MSAISDIKIKPVTISSPEYGEVWELREKVLRIPLGLSLKNEDYLSKDKTDIILAAQHHNKVIGCLILHHVDGGTLRLRAMAVYNEWQGKGIGRLLVEHAEKYAWQNYDKIVLHARKVAVEFYRKLGYKIVSDEFIEVTIPHFMMEKLRK